MVISEHRKRLNYKRKSISHIMGMIFLKSGKCLHSFKRGGESGGIVVAVTQGIRKGALPFRLFY